MKMSVAPREQAIDPQLNEQVEGVTANFPGGSHLIVLTACIKQGRVRQAAEVVRRRYIELSARSGVPIDVSCLRKINEQSPVWSVRLGELDQLIIRQTSIGWDMCLVAIGSLVDALILRSLLVKPELGIGATSVSVVTSGAVVA